MGRREKEEKALRKLGSKKYTLLFLDGTHENFDLLGKYPETEWNGGKVQQISGNLYHMMRGQIYEIEGKKFFAFGGGESVEKQIRMQAGKWWACEMPSRDEMREGARNLKSAGMEVDYILTHYPPPRMISGSLGNQIESRNQLEAFFEQIVKNVKYKKWFFGFVHTDRKITYKNFSVFDGVIPVEDPPVKKRLFHR